MKEYTNCPICNSKSFKYYLKCKDNTVSKDVFQIVECTKCSFKFTNPIPEVEKIGSYYESEEYISHSNSNRTIIDKLYQIVRKYTLSKKYRLVKRISNGKNLLDVGSGTGEFLDICNRKGLTVKGIEPSRDARDYSIKNYGLDVSDETALKQIDSNSLDIISMWHVLEHVYNLQDRVEELARILKKSGTLLVAVPNCSSYDAKHYKENWAAYDVPRHLYHFTPNDIKSLFESNGFTLESILPMKFDSFYVSLLSEKYKNGKLNYLKALYIGMKSNLKAAGRNEYSSQIYILKKV